MSRMRYASLEEVPQHLNTVSDWRTVGRRVKPGAQPPAEVAINSRKHEKLYTIYQTEQIPGLTDEALRRLKSARACRLCGQMRRNRHGKVILPGVRGLCARCSTTKNTKKGTPP